MPALNTFRRRHQATRTARIGGDYQAMAAEDVGTLNIGEIEATWCFVVESFTNCRPTSRFETSSSRCVSAPIRTRHLLGLFVSASRTRRRHWLVSQREACQCKKATSRCDSPTASRADKAPPDVKSSSISKLRAELTKLVMLTISETRSSYPKKNQPCGHKSRIRSADIACRPQEVSPQSSEPRRTACQPILEALSESLRRKRLIRP